MLDASLFYTGVGSRETPDDVLDLMRRVAHKLAHEGWILRSGHAPGADQAFEEGAGGQAEIFLPWAKFEKGVPLQAMRVYPRPAPWAYGMATMYLYGFARWRRSVQALHARNIHQVFGYDRKMPTSTMLVCWRHPDGRRGGTDTAVSMFREARGFHTDDRIFELQTPMARGRVEAWLESSQHVLG